MCALFKIKTIEKEELIFKAKMTQIQFYSLALKLNKSRLVKELKLLKYFINFNCNSNCDLGEIKKWIINGWNTEYLLRINYSTLKNDALRNSLHWAFPQAYYSVYTVCLAFFKAAGFTESSHTSVISKVGKLMYEGKYPDSISFLATGGKHIEFINIAKSDIPSTIYFEKTQSCIDTQICQFLKSTREMSLNERKKQTRILTKERKKKSHFSKLDWERVSTNIGYTSVLNLLYRKRIKSNYRDIETYLCQELDPGEVYKYLISITSSINFVHESFLIQGIGESQFLDLTKNLNKGIKKIFRNRIMLLKK